MSRSLLALGVVAAGLLAAAKGEPPQAPSPRLIPIDELVRQLGSEDFREREAATKRLGALALDPPPEVLAATRSDNPEVRDRAKKVAAAMRLNLAVERLPRGEGFARRGDADLFVAATTVWDLAPNDPRLWNPALAFGRKILDVAEMNGKPRPNLKRDLNVNRAPGGCPALLGTFAAYRECYAYYDPAFYRTDAEYRRPKGKGPPTLWHAGLQAPAVPEVYNLCSCIVVSRGPVGAESTVQASLILANGNIKAGLGVSRTVIVCDGDVEVREDLGKSVVIARGNITVRGSTDSCVLIAGGKVGYTDADLPQSHTFNVVKENEPNPLGFITFFELARVGLEAKSANGAVAVAAVKGGSASEKAGVKVGDTVLDVGGKKPTDAESLRRLLRDALAVGDATVKLKRGNETVTVKLSLPE